MSTECHIIFRMREVFNFRWRRLSREVFVFVLFFGVMTSVSELPVPRFGIRSQTKELSAKLTTQG